MLSDAVAFSEGRVRGFIHRASGDGRDGLVLTHGSGGNARMALLEVVARAFADAGICVPVLGGASRRWHPPSRPQQARTSHWPALRTPALFVHGSRDPFASSAELRAAVALIPALTRIDEIEGAGHDLGRGAWNAKEMVVAPFWELMAR